MRKNIFRLLFIICLILIIKELIMINYVNYENNMKVKNYYSKEYSYYKNNMVIKIPKINLNAFVSKADNNFNNLNKTLVYYKNKDYHKTIIILGHSGMGYGTFFNKIDELEEEDNLYLFIGNCKIHYKLNRKYYVDYKDISILNRNSKNTLILITCKKNDKKKRLVEEFVLKSEQKP